MASSAESQFIEFSVLKLRQLLSRIHVCLEKLDDSQIWRRGGENENAVGNLCLHLAGNVRQWILHGVGGEPDRRTRDKEFAARGGAAKAEIWAALDSTVQAACGLLEGLPGDDLMRTVRPQSYDVSVLEAIYHVVEHFAQHTGQILFMTKALTGGDLGFYRHLAGTTEPPPPPAGQEIP